MDSDAGTEGQTAAATQSKHSMQDVTPRQAPGPLTCMTMAQRLNRSKFLTIVYYKPGQKNY